MPHFVIDCSQEILDLKPEDEILREVHLAAVSAELFGEGGNVKVRINPYENCLFGGNKNELFIHVFSTIMEGRTIEQKARLSRAIVTKLVEMFPSVPNVAMNVNEFEKLSYCHKGIVQKPG